jgi:hypothetical protein
VEGYNFNRILGVDYNYSFLNNKITGSSYYHKQFTPQKVDQSFAHGFGFQYNTRTLDLNWFHQIFGAGYDPAVGYLPRTGYKRISPSGNLRFFPKSDLIINHGPNLDLAYIWDDKYGYTDHEQTVGYNVQFRSNATISATYQNIYTYLFRDFDPTNSPAEVGAVELPDSTTYNYSVGGLSYRSDPRKLFSIELDALYGNYFNGTRLGVKGTFNYRIQPYGVISMNFNYNKIELPQPYQSADIYLVGPRLDLTVSRSVFFTTFFQYNSQFNNVNINSRFQWRFKPVSDLFIVYTDNYYYSFDQPNQNFNPKTRAIVIKLTYWLNM